MSSHSWLGSQWHSWLLCVKGPVQESQNGSIASLPEECLVTQDQLCEEVHSGSGGSWEWAADFVFLFGVLSFLYDWAISPARQFIF